LLGYDLLTLFASLGTTWTTSAQAADEWANSIFRFRNRTILKVGNLPELTEGKGGYSLCELTKAEL